MNLVESLKATFKKRPGGRSFYIICLVVLAFLTDLPIGVNSVEFMYVKRRFQWEVDKISFYSTVLNAASNMGLITSMPLFHYFNINDSVIILLSLFSNMVFYLYKMLVKTENAFFASSAFGCMINLFYAPIRVQVTRCVSTEDLGKVEKNERKRKITSFYRFLQQCLVFSLLLQYWALLSTPACTLPQQISPIPGRHRTF